MGNPRPETFPFHTSSTLDSLRERKHNERRVWASIPPARPLLPCLDGIKRKNKFPRGCCHTTYSIPPQQQRSTAAAGSSTNTTGTVSIPPPVYAISEAHVGSECLHSRGARHTLAAFDRSILLCPCSARTAGEAYAPCRSSSSSSPSASSSEEGQSSVIHRVPFPFFCSRIVHSVFLFFVWSAILFYLSLDVIIYSCLQQQLLAPHFVRMKARRRMIHSLHVQVQARFISYDMIVLLSSAVVVA